MGDWGFSSWENDEAAGFHRFWKEGFPLLINEIGQFDPAEERYDSVRAACYLLESLDIVYVWPVQYGDQLNRF